MKHQAFPSQSNTRTGKRFDLPPAGAARHLLRTTSSDKEREVLELILVLWENPNASDEELRSRVGISAGTLCRYLHMIEAGYVPGSPAWKESLDHVLSAHQVARFVSEVMVETSVEDWSERLSLGLYHLVPGQPQIAILLNLTALHDEDSDKPTNLGLLRFGPSGKSSSSRLSIPALPCSSRCDDDEDSATSLILRALREYRVQLATHLPPLTRRFSGKNGALLGAVALFYRKSYAKDRASAEIVLDELHTVIAPFIRTVLRSDRSKTCTLASLIAIRSEHLARDFELSARHHEVLTLTAMGHSQSEIGNLLCISPVTVRNHLTALRRKLGVSNARELLRLFTGLPIRTITS